jgi:hypothetical protein
MKNNKSDLKFLLIFFLIYNFFFVLNESETCWKIKEKVVDYHNSNHKIINFGAQLFHFNRRVGQLLLFTSNLLKIIDQAWKDLESQVDFSFLIDFWQL